MEFIDFQSALSEYYSLSEIKFLYQYIHKEQKKPLFSEIIDRLKQHEPIDYILGYTYFYGQRYLVDTNTLIPRPETEELVELIIEKHRHEKGLSILDIGTGSGCIAISLSKHFPDAQITGIDISEQAIQKAKENAKLNLSSVQFYPLDILNPSQWQTLQTYDIIVSNPPYIALSEKGRMTPSVIDYEPETALFVPDTQPLIFYTQILEFAKTHGTPKTQIYFETHQDYQLQSHEGFHIQSFHDLSENNRFLICSPKQ